jgi:hypothetical protein
MPTPNVSRQAAALTTGLSGLILVLATAACLPPGSSGPPGPDATPLPDAPTAAGDGGISMIGPTATDGTSASSVDASTAPGTVNDSQIPSVDQIRAWQAEIDEFDDGFRPTGSPAHEGYIQRLVQELTQLGVSDVHTEPFTFTRWTPSTWSLSLLGAASPDTVRVSGYIPYSGTTGPLGLTAPLAYLPVPPIAALDSLDPAQTQAALRDPATFWSSAVSPTLQAAVAAIGGVTGKVVVVEVPNLTLPLGGITGVQLYVNDPAGQLGPQTPVTRIDYGAMLYLPAALEVLAASGAVGVVAVLDAPEPLARGLYAPFYGAILPELPGLYVDRMEGARLKQVLDSSGGLLLAQLELQASFSRVNSENVVGTIPGASTQELILSSHTDGTNSLEDNGPAAILALVSYFLKQPRAERPRTFRIVLTGGHFVGSQGILDYVLEHFADLQRDALCVLELEHLGAREWTELAPGTMSITGHPEVQMLANTPVPALIDASTAFARQFPRSLVTGPAIFGEGQHYRGLPLIQYLTAPSFLLSAHVPEITRDLTDYDLMRAEIVAFAEMLVQLGKVPAAELGAESAAAASAAGSP